MKCPVCGAAELIHDTRDLTCICKGEVKTILAVTGDYCPTCAEPILDGVESERVMRETRGSTGQAAVASEGRVTGQ